MKIENGVYTVKTEKRHINVKTPPLHGKLLGNFGVP